MPLRGIVRDMLFTNKMTMTFWEMIYVVIHRPLSKPKYVVHNGTGTTALQKSSGLELIRGPVPVLVTRDAT